MKPKLRLFILIFCLAVCGLSTSCLKETPLVVVVVVDFGYKLTGEYQTTPLTITLENNTTGADSFEWTFEGGSPSASSDKNPRDCVVLVENYFKTNFPDLILDKKGNYTGWWWAKYYMQDASLRVDFDGDYGGHFFVYVYIGDTKYELWQFDKSVIEHSESNTENICIS